MILEEQKQKGKMPEFNKLNKMKKISFLRATLLAATLVVAGYGGMKAYDYSYAKRVNSDDAMLIANVEALSDGEDVPQLPCDYLDDEHCTFQAVGPSGKLYDVRLDDMVRTSK